MKKLACLLLIVAVMLTISLSSALAQEKVSLEIWSAASGMPADDANVILPAIEEATGLDLEWNVFSSDYDVSLNVRLGSGDFPDIFEIPYNMIGTCLKQGVLLDVSTIWDQLGDVAAVYSESDHAHMFYDGEMCVIPVRQNLPYLSFNLRKDWLDNLGMEIPTTLDELYDVLYAFTYNDPDGNGKNDTYGLSGAGIKGFSAILMAFGVAEPNNFIIRDGQLVFSAIDDGMKDAVTFIKKMVDAGVVDPEMMTNSSSEHRDKAIRGEVGMVWIDLWNMHKQVYADQIKAINPNAEWILLDGVEGPGGKYAYSNPTASATRYYALSADLEDEPEKLAAAIQLLNYLSNPTTGGRLVSFGIEGVHYELGENDAIIALPAMNDLTYSWVYQLTGREDYDYLCAKFGYAREFIDYIASDSISLLNTYNGAVSAPETVNVADIERYAEEELTRFIYGERSLDEWDSYVATLRNVYGLDAYIAKAESDLKTAGYLE